MWSPDTDHIETFHDTALISLLLKMGHESDVHGSGEEDRPPDSLWVSTETFLQPHRLLVIRGLSRTGNHIVVILDILLYIIQDIHFSPDVGFHDE